MAAHMLAASSSNLQVTCLSALRFFKCEHMNIKINEIVVVENHRTLLDVFEDKHDKMTKTSELKITCNTSIDNSGTSFEVQPKMIIGDLISTFNMKRIEFQCVNTAPGPTLDEMIIAAGQATTKTAVDAFQLMMAGGRKDVPLKTPSKDRLLTTEHGTYISSDEEYLKDPELHLSKWNHAASVLYHQKPKPLAAAGSAQQYISCVDLPVLQSALASYFDTNHIFYKKE